MKSLRHILVPVDFSDTSSLILRQGIRLAAWNASTLHVIHVIGTGWLQDVEARRGKLDLGQIEAAARERLDALLREAGLEPGEVDAVVKVGRPVEGILQRIEETNADLVILSAHDTTRKRLGSVASHVVRQAGCKVLLARDWQPGAFRRIAVAIDFSPLSAEVFSQAVWIACQEQAELEVIHVRYPLQDDMTSYLLDFDAEDEDAFRIREDAKLQAKIDALMVPHREELDRIPAKWTILEASHPAIPISSHLRASGPDLVVVGTTGQENWFGLRFGSNAERLVHETECSVLAVKPPVKG